METARKIRPLRDLILVEPRIRKLSDVIHVENKEKFNEGTIVEIGPRVHDAKVGDFIKYGNGTYLDWPVHEINGRKYQLIQEADIACIVDK